MGKYGEVAILAVQAVHSKASCSPIDAWKVAAENIFPDSLSQQRKACPRSAFLGLCSEGLIRGIPVGDYTRCEKNTDYALRAIAILREDPTLCDDVQGLWKMAIGAATIKSNSQMDVVTALWKGGWINPGDHNG